MRKVGSCFDTCEILEGNDRNWQQFMEEQTKTSSPESLIAHQKQMKKDLKIIKYFTLKHYTEIVEDKSTERIAQYKHSYDQKCKQTIKLEDKISTLE